MDNLDKHSLEVLSRSFDLEASSDFKLFREELIRRLSYLINHDFEKLIWILYRIDVNEQMVTEVLSDTQNSNPSERLADLIIQRQMQKAETRQKFRDKDGKEIEGDY